MASSLFNLSLLAHPHPNMDLGEDRALALVSLGSLRSMNSAVVAAGCCGRRGLRGLWNQRSQRRGPLCCRRHSSSSSPWVATTLLPWQLLRIRHQLVCRASWSIVPLMPAATASVPAATASVPAPTASVPRRSLAADTFSVTPPPGQQIQPNEAWALDVGQPERVVDRFTSNCHLQRLSPLASALALPSHHGYMRRGSIPAPAVSAHIFQASFWGGPWRWGTPCPPRPGRRRRLPGGSLHKVHMVDLAGSASAVYILVAGEQVQSEGASRALVPRSDSILQSVLPISIFVVPASVAGEL